MAMLRDKFRGCLLGAALGDVIGAVVEAESPAYIASEFASVDAILSTDTVPEFIGPPWQVGRFTDDTQMTHCVAEWLLEDDRHSAENLLARFAAAYEPWRRYGSGTEAILRMFPEHRESWRELSTMMFPEGSHGNGCAMRVAPVGLAYSNDPARLKVVAIESSRPTHSHWLAYQGAVLQAVAVARATSLTQYSAASFLRPLRASLASFADLLQSTSQFGDAIDMIEQGLSRGVSCAEMSAQLGTGVDVVEAVPMALYCFLRHPDSYAEVIHQAVYIGGDTDTIASMAGAISGAFLGEQAIPSHWLRAVREERYSVAAMQTLADRLWAKFARGHAIG